MPDLARITALTFVSLGAWRGWQGLKLLRYRAQLRRLPHYVLGHVGDGNFHFGYLIEPDSRADWEIAERLNHALVRRALALGGTCSGEHGIGLHKIGFRREEAGEAGIAMMRAIKQALDPLGILNPGKILG